MLNHIKAAKTSLWNNAWSEVFDFTPKKDGDDLHWKIAHKLTDTYATTSS